MLSLQFAISLKFSRAGKKVVTNSFCCFVFELRLKRTVTNNAVNARSKFKIV